jgi:hypothetical protein
MTDIVLLRIIKETLQKNLDMYNYDILASEIEEKVRLYYGSRKQQYERGIKLVLLY